MFVDDSITLDLTMRDAGEIKEWIVETEKDRIMLFKIQSETGEPIDQTVVQSILTVYNAYTKRFINSIQNDILTKGHT